LSGEMYTTRQRRALSGGGANMARSRHHKNAVNVFPVPVGEKMSVDSPRAIAGHPSICGRVADGNERANHSRTAG
jgi:hypothetical protein